MSHPKKNTTLKTRAEENIWACGAESDGEGKKLRNADLHNIRTSRNIIIKIKSKQMEWECSTHGNTRNAYLIMAGALKGI
jgi:hypothetical protein